MRHHYRKTLLRKPKPKPPCYVIVYDRKVGLNGDETVEEYYGYFSSPDEASAIWQSYAGPGIDTGFENVKLCRVVKDWS